MNGWFWFGVIYAWAFATFALMAAETCKNARQVAVIVALSLLWPLIILTPRRWRREPEG